MIWTGEEVSKYCSTFSKVNPNGVDLSPIAIYEIPNLPIYLKGSERGYLNNNEFIDQRNAKKEIIIDESGFYNLEANKLYELRFPKVKIPMEATGFAYPRSSLVRLGVIKIQTAVWDSGYEGEATQSVYLIQPLKIHKSEAWIQLVFMENKEKPKTSYNGHYQNESK